MSHRLFGLLLALGVVGAAAPAAAQVKSATRDKDGDNYVFKDELVNSDVTFPRGGSIVVRPPAQRVLLIRVRASFVPEMLKSVEHM